MCNSRPMLTRENMRSLMSSCPFLATPVSQSLCYFACEISLRSFLEFFSFSLFAFYSSYIPHECYRPMLPGDFTYLFFVYFFLLYIINIIFGKTSTVIIKKKQKSFKLLIQLLLLSLVVISLRYFFPRRRCRYCNL